MTTILLSGSSGLGGLGTYTKPAGVRTITVEGWGAGGSGSGFYRSGSNFFSIATCGGAGGAYAKSIVIYPPEEQILNYYISTPTGSGNLSASIWYAADNTTPAMIALRGAHAPSRAFYGIPGSSSYDGSKDLNGNDYRGPTGSINGSFGNLLRYAGGSVGLFPNTANNVAGPAAGGAGSTGPGKNSIAPVPSEGLPGVRGGITADFGGSGSLNWGPGASPVPQGGLYGGGGGGFLMINAGDPNTWSTASLDNSSYGGRGLIRITLDTTPLPNTGGITWNGNILLFGYSLDNAVSYSTTIDGSQMVRIEDGTEYSWIPNTNYVLEGDVRWIPTTSTDIQTGWDGATGWRAFLEYARAKNTFLFFSNLNQLVSPIESYLVEPLNGQHDLEIDGTRRIRLVIRNTTTAYTGF